MKKIFLLLVFNLASLCFVGADGTQRQIDIYIIIWIRNSI